MVPLRIWSQVYNKSTGGYSYLLLTRAFTLSGAINNLDLHQRTLQVLDDHNVRRRFRFSTYQSTTRLKPFICTMPMRLGEGWNMVKINLADFTRQAYETNYVETLRVQIHANCCIKRVYFSDRLYSEDELPAEFKAVPKQAKQ